MDVFHDAAELMVLGSRIAAEASRQEEEQGPDALSATAQDVGGDRIDECHTGIEVGPCLAFHPLQLITVRLPDVRHVVDSGCDWGLGHAADGRAEKETKSSW